MARLFAPLFLLALPVCSLFSQTPTVHTSRTSPQVLPLPKSDDAFHFIIFGDRTGGPPDGVKVLADAVRDTNMLDPDLVMTVGDLVQGYNAQPLWEKQMTEYRGIMQKLRMPWFPVAGNHDIYWRGEGRPPTEHEADFEKHFGPLWYWFEHKKCGFLVLFSDEGDQTKPDAVRSFESKTQQKFSDKQMAWLKQSLAEMKDLKHVFVFMHHPRWAPDLYPESNWSEVHKLLVANGNVRSCFAGHIHRLRYDGIRDGIEYIALAATGAVIPGDYPRLGYLHHFNVVSVRPEGARVTTVPVGAVIDPTLFTPERARDIDSARKMTPEHLTGPMDIGADGLGAGLYQIRIANPTQRPLEATLAPELSREWIVTPDHMHATLEPGKDYTFSLSYVRVKPGLKDPVVAPVFVLDLDYLEEGARTPLPAKRFPAKIRRKELPAEVFAPATPEQALHFTAEKTAISIPSSAFDLPNGPFTVECWVRRDGDQRTAGLVAKMQSSDYGLIADNNIISFLAYVDDRYAAATAKAPIPANQWVHVAGVFDGARVALFLDGKLADAVPAKGLRLTNELPLMIGSDPDAKSAPSRSFTGWIDEVRVSKIARYTADFQPARRFEPDAETVLLYHGDRMANGLVPDHSASHAHAPAVGKVEIAPAP